LIRIALAHLEDRAAVAETTQRHLMTLDLERAVFVDPEGRERAEITRAPMTGDTDREAAQMLRSILRDYFS
jgi:hypothetical protein